MKHTYTLPSGGTPYAPYLLEMVQGNHTLIAGTVGAGKSVLENSIIYAMLSARYPGQTASGRGAQFVLLDPKKVELRMYKNLPHTLAYADNIPDILNVLHMVRGMIDDRFKRMQRRGERQSSECPVYVFIDELVDIVTNAKHGKEIVNLLSDIASISRAANCFIIALTQSPSRVIIPARFKLLFNCRCALRCNNAIESRQIIEDDSAVSLPLHGRGIVEQNLSRYQIDIPFYSDEEIKHNIRHWTKQNNPLGRLLAKMA